MKRLWHKITYKIHRWWIQLTCIHEYHIWCWSEYYSGWDDDKFQLIVLWKCDKCGKTYRTTVPYENVFWLRKHFPDEEIY